MWTALGNQGFGHEGQCFVCGMTLKSVLTLAQATEGSTAANIYEMKTMMIDKIILGTYFRAILRTVFLKL